MLQIFLVSLLKTHESHFKLGVISYRLNEYWSYAILNAGGERAAKTTQSMYWSCHDLIRTQKLNHSQITAKVVRTVIWNCGPVPTQVNDGWFICSLHNNPAKIKRIGFLAESETKPSQTKPNQIKPLAKTGPLAGYPDLLVALMVDFSVLQT
jgi:hypothetical protein